jgi:hypothetical protein
MGNDYTALSAEERDKLETKASILSELALLSG